MLSKSVVLLFAAAALASAAPHLKWRDLDRLARGHRIAIELPSGVKLQGQPIAFNDDDLVLNVTKTSDKHAYPKGRGVVPRPEVQRVRILKTSHTWRYVGAAIGGGVGTAAAIPVATYLQNEGGNAAAALLVATPALALGYLAGWGADHTVMEIVVDPD